MTRVTVHVNGRSFHATDADAEGLRAFVRGLYLALDDDHAITKHGARYVKTVKRTGRVVCEWSMAPAPDTD